MVQPIRTMRARVVGVKEYGENEEFFVEVEDMNNYGTVAWVRKDTCFGHPEHAKKYAEDIVSGKTRTETRTVGSIIGREFASQYTNEIVI